MIPVLAFVVLGCGLLSEEAGQEIRRLSRDALRAIENLVPEQIIIGLDTSS